MGDKRPKHRNSSRRTIRKGDTKASQQDGWPSGNQYHPKFSLRHTVKDHCISKCSVEEKASFAETIRKLSQLSWAEIYTKHRHGLGCEPIAHNSINVGIPPIVTEDTTLCAFRFQGMKAMIGFREGPIFYILWFDNKFKIYDH